MGSPPPGSKYNSVHGQQDATDDGKYRVMVVQRGKNPLLCGTPELLSCTWSCFEGNSVPLQLKACQLI